jgi:hypothetical protein
MAKKQPEGTTRGLKISERFALLTVLPDKGNFLDMRVVAKLREELNLRDNEIELFEVKPIEGVSGGITWNKKKDRGVNITFGERAMDIIVGALKNLNEDSLLEERHITLYEMFVENK